MKNISFRKKLWLPLIFSLVCISATFVHDAIQLRNIRIEERRNELTNIAEIGVHTVKKFDELAQSHVLSKEEAQKQALSAVRNMRYGKDGYIAIANFEGVAVMHPIRSALEGKSMLEFKDKNGQYIYKEVLRLAKTGDGNGFYTYAWERPGENRAVPKLTRVATYQPWGWVLTVGEYMDDIDDAFKKSLYESAAILAAMCILLSLLVLLVNRSLRFAIGGDPEYASSIASRISDNDFSTPITTQSRDATSIVYAMKNMQSRLALTVTEVRRSAESIAIASKQIAVGNLDLSSRTEEQAATLEETVSSMEELTSTVKQNAENARNAGNFVQKASKMAEQGGEVATQVMNTMGGITESSRKMADIISVIDGIAFQTNILALNAAVEAARAGEQGRGFAVVASEVRNLAQRSSQAAKEIKDLIDDSVTRVNQGSELVNRAGQTMIEVVSSVKEVEKIMNEITITSEKQSAGITQAHGAIVQMDQVTQQNAALVEQAAAAASSLDEQAKQLQRLVSIFKIS